MELIQLVVLGNCDICKQRIEDAAMSVKGVLSATWDIKTSKLFLTIESRKATVDKISRVIANAGHNTEMHEVEDNIHNALPECCKCTSETRSALKANAV